MRGYVNIVYVNIKHRMKVGSNDFDLAEKRGSGKKGRVKKYDVFS